MCDFKFHSSFRGRKAEESPEWLLQTAWVELNKRWDSSQARNDRKIIPRTIAPPGRAVIPRTLAPPCKAKQNNLILAPPGAYPHRLKGGGALAAEGFNLGIWRKVVPRTLAPPCRAVIPRTLAPPGRAVLPGTLASPGRAVIPGTLAPPGKNIPPGAYPPRREESPSG